MRCQSCDDALSSHEATRKFMSGEFVDLCDNCFETIKDQVVVIEKPDQQTEIDDGD